MTNPNATHPELPGRAGNTTFTGTDDTWGNGNATNRETGCVDAFYSRRDRSARCCRRGSAATA